METRGEKLRRPLISTSPWLVYTQHNEIIKWIQTFCSVSPLPPHNKSYSRRIPELRGKIIRGSSYGWLILIDSKDKKIISLWNPLTLKTIILPILEASQFNNRRDISCTLTSSPADHESNCFFLVFCDSFVYSCRVSQNGVQSPWASQRLKLEGNDLEYVKNIVACNGINYGLATTRVVDLHGYTTWPTSLVIVEMVAAEKKNPVVTLRPLHLGLPELPDFSHVGYITYTLESCGMLYMVYFFIRMGMQAGYIASSIKIWELDLQVKTWVEVNSLGDRAFFLDSNNCCTWCWATTESGVEPNCVYSLMRHTNDDESIRTVLCLYRIEDCSLTPLLPRQNLVTPWYGPTWLMPLHLQERKSSIKNSVHIKDQVITKENICSDYYNPVTETNMFLSLPADLIALISSKYLHSFDYLNLRATCKSFQSALCLAQPIPKNSPPLFMFCKKDQGLCKVMDPYRSDSYSFVIPILEGDIFVDFSKDGWLLLCMDTKSWQYFNPFTRVRGFFPPLENAQFLNAIGFSSYPTSPECLTVGIASRVNSIDIYYNLSGKETWDWKEFENQQDGFVPGDNSSPVYIDGTFYFLGKSGHLGVFKLVGGDASWQVYGEPKTLNTTLLSYHLVECDGELLSVFIGEMGDWLQVFRFNHSDSKWVELKSLGNYNLFVGPHSSVSAVTRDEGLRNRIYLPRIKDNNIVYYSLEDDMYHAGKDSMMDFYGTTEYLRCCWI